MIIDWFTVSAQIVNFLILVWLLNRFLYKPILNAIDAREQSITNQLEEAAAIKASAQQERQTFEQNNALIEQQRVELLSQANQQADAERQRLIEIARSETANLSEQWRESLANQQDSLKQQLIKRTEQEVFAIARKTLADLATADLEQQITAVFIQRLQTQSEQLQKQLSSSSSTPSEKVYVRSTIELPVDQQSAIKNAIQHSVKHDISIHFETASDLLCGIELVIGSFKIAWSIDDYLQRMESTMSELAQQTSLHNTINASA